MADKKNDKKVKETLQEKDLDKVTGGMDDYPARPRPEDDKGPKKNIFHPTI